MGHIWPPKFLKTIICILWNQHIYCQICIVCLKVVAKCCFKWIFLHGDLYYCVQYINEDTKLRSSNFIVKTSAQKRMADLVLDINFMIFCCIFQGLIIHKDIIKKIYFFRKSSIQYNFIIFFSFNNYLLILPLTHSLAPSSQICRLFRIFFCQHKLLSFVDQYVFTCLHAFISQNSKSQSILFWITVT